MVFIGEPQSTGSSASTTPFGRPGPTGVSMEPSLDVSLPSVSVVVASTNPNGGATEHTHQTQEDIFTIAQAAKRRETQQGVHKQMRDLLNKMTAAEQQKPVTTNPWVPKRVEVPPLTPWKIYLAHHKDSDDIIGTGVRHFYGQFRSRIDSNRNDQLRFDFVVERADGSHVTLHPGNLPKNDAKVHMYQPGEFRP